MSEPASRSRGELLLALLLVLAGSGLAFLVAGRQWVDVTLPRAAPLPPLPETLTGADVVGALRPLAFLGVAGAAALLATRGPVRVLLGALLTAAGAGLGVAVVRAVSEGVFSALADHRGPGALAPTGAEPGFEAWWSLALVAALLQLAGGLLIAVRGRRWTALSSRYDTPAARAEKPPARVDVATWDALDRGEDPTLRQSGETASDHPFGTPGEDRLTPSDPVAAPRLER